MRFAFAAALCLASHGASADEKLANESVARSNQRNALRGITQQVTQNGQHTRQLQKPTTQKLIRRLAKKRQERALKSANILVEDRKSTLFENQADIAVPDLGVIGGRNLELDKKLRNVSQNPSDRDLKESIIDKDSILEISREETYGVPEDTIDVYKYSILDELEYYCTELPGDELISCDCSNFDFASTNGTIECTYSDNGADFCQVANNYCGESVEICYQHSISLQATTPKHYDYTYCLQYTRPYFQKVCLNFNQTAEDESDYQFDEIEPTVTNRTSGNYYTFTKPSPSPCSVQFNDMECNSCSTEIETIRRYSFNEETDEDEITSISQERCFLVDCSNTGDEKNIVNTCNSGSIQPTLKDNVIFGDDCTRCQPCGLGYRVKNLDAEGFFPVIGEYQCSGLELAAKIGFFDRKLCPEVQAKTAEYCGCEPIFYDPALVSSPMEKTSRSDIDSSSSSTDSYGALVLLPGDTIGDKKCDVCGSQQAIVANPGAIVTLPNGVMTSCSALEGAGRLGMFTADYCLSEVMPLVFRSCGGCFHDQEVNFFNPESILLPPPTEEKEEKEEEEDESINPSSSNFVVGESILACDICDSGSELALPNNLFTLSNEEISCQDFEDRLKNTAVTETFCVEEASAIADAHCGGCVAKAGGSTLINVDNGSVDMIASRMDGEDDRKSKAADTIHREKPDEIDVDSDPLVTESNINKSAPNAVISAESSSSKSFTETPKTWIAVSTALAISYSFLAYFS